MIKILSLLLLVLLVKPALAQNKDTIPLYQKSPAIPSFKIFTASDSTLITESDLEKKRPVMFILFNPDCDHCKRAFADLVNNIELYKNVTIVMSSSIRYDLIQNFYNENHVAFYSNIIMGRDPGGKLNTYFANRFMPGIYVYDKNGKFSFDIRTHPDFKAIAEMIR